MKKTFKWLGISILTIIAIVGIAFCLFLYFLTPERLTPIVNKYCTEYLDAKVNFESVQVSIFEEFPKLSVKLTGGEIISHVLQADTAFSAEHPANVDTLMRFNEFMISLNIIDLINSKINIQRIRISQPSIYAYISPSGRANWEIYTPTEPDDDSPPLDLNIDRFSIQGPAVLTCKSCPDSMSFRASIGRLFLRGNITPDFENLKINQFVCSDVDLNADIEAGNINARLKIDSGMVDVVEQRREYNLKIKGMVSANAEKQNYCDLLPLRLNGTLMLEPENETFFGFKNFGVVVADLPEIKLNGDILLSAGEITSDLNCKVDALSLQSLLHLIPKGLSDEIRKIRTDIKISLNTTIKGVYQFDEAGKLPTITADLKIPKGSLIYKDLASKIENITVDASLHFNPTSPEKTGIKFKTINVEAFAVRLNGKADITNLLKDPKVSLNLSGNAKLRELMAFLPENSGIMAHGDISFAAEGSFLASRLNVNDLVKNELTVQLDADRLRLRIPQNKINVLAEKTSIKLNTADARVNKTTGEVLRGLNIELKSDTARVGMSRREVVTLSKVDFSMRTSDALLTGDTLGVIPMVGNISANTLAYSGVDSATIRLRGIKSNFRILPSRANRTLPTIRFDAEARQINAYTEGNRLSARNASFVLEAAKNAPVQEKRRIGGQRSDSLRLHDTQPVRSGLQNRKTGVADDFKGEDVDMKDAELGSILREWTVSGNIKSRSGRVVTPYFPIRTLLQNIDLAFTTDDITLQNVGVRCGESKFNFTGKINGIRRALSSGTGLKIEAGIKADTLNINELLTAIYNGAAYSEASDEYKKSLVNAQDEEQLEKLIQKENGGRGEAPKLIVVPSNVSVDVKLDVEHGKYADIIIRKLTGSLISRDRCLQLKDIAAKTNVGDIDMTALYATRSKKDITFGIDLEFKDIRIEKMIEIIPSVDSLLPMLSSFKGVVNCQVAATAALDSTMDVIMPNLNAACRISGKNMTLLDGETFSEIARTLKFKNRDRNLVESISVEMLLHDNQIEVFPFIMQMDRYKAAIGGIHKLDMTFNYHISVLKSPLPFAIGLNLSGTLDNLDKMKIGIGRVKYKDTNLPTYVTLIDNTRLNLRTQINNFIQQGVDVARFRKFSAPAIDSSLIEKEAESLVLTETDSLALYKEGIIDEAPALVRDSIASRDNQSQKRRGRR